MSYDLFRNALIMIGEHNGVEPLPAGDSGDLPDCNVGAL